MPAFLYTALDPAGKEVSGALTAPGRGDVLAQIAAKGLYPVRVEERDRPVRGRAAAAAAPRHVSQSAVEAFMRQLANLLRAGVPLGRALLLLSREASRPSVRALWTHIHDEVVGGVSLADALARYPRIFPAVYVAMVRAGETGGFLEVVLEQIADFRSREQDLRGRVVAALVYPAVLASLAALVLVFLLTYFIPRFSAIFAEFGGALPWLTRAIVAASDLVLRHGALLAVGAAIAVAAGRRAAASPAGRRFVERMLLRAPVIGHVLSHFALVRFCRMLGTLLGAGVPLILALRVAREAIGNQTLADAVTHAVEDVQRGAPLARSLSASKEAQTGPRALAVRALFPAEVIEMVAVAEESGRLDKELVRVAAAYEGELDRRLRMAVALAEPLLLFLMAAVVGTVVIGMLLPVFTLQDLIR